MESCFTIYDVAIRDKLEEKIPNKVILTPVDRALLDRQTQFMANREKAIEGTVLPFISFWRVGDSNNLEQFYNEALFRIGMRVGFEEGEITNLVKRLHVLPTRLEYNFELWSVDKVVLDEIYREFMFCILGNPSVKIKVADVEFIYSLELVDEEDNTDILAQLEAQKLYRRTVKMAIPQARIHMLEEIQVPKSISIDYKVDVNLKEE